MIGEASSIAGNVALVLILIRAWQGKYITEFRLFYSYILFWLFCGLSSWVLVIFFPSQYPSVFFLMFAVTGLLAEFVVLVEISGQLFRSYVVIRGLARLAIGSICLILFVSYVLPSVLRKEAVYSSFAVFSGRAGITLFTMLIGFLIIAKYFNVSLGRNAKGLCAGFAILEAGRIATYGFFSHGDSLLRVISYQLFPLFGFLSTAAWAYGLWRLDPSPTIEMSKENNVGLKIQDVRNLVQPIERLMK